MTFRKTKIVFPVFNGFQVRVILSSNVENTARALHSSAEDCDAVCITEETKPGMCWLVFEVTPPVDVIAHEAYHAVVAMLQWAGAKREEEVVAHHVGYLAGKIYDFVKEGAV